MPKLRYPCPVGSRRTGGIVVIVVIGSTGPGPRLYVTHPSTHPSVHPPFYLGLYFGDEQPKLKTKITEHRRSLPCPVFCSAFCSTPSTPSTLPPFAQGCTRFVLRCVRRSPDRRAASRTGVLRYDTPWPQAVHRIWIWITRRSSFLPDRTNYRGRIRIRIPITNPSWVGPAGPRTKLRHYEKSERPDRRRRREAVRGQAQRPDSSLGSGTRSRRPDS